MKVYEQIIQLASSIFTCFSRILSCFSCLMGEGWARAMARAGTPQGEGESHGSLPKGAFAGVGCFTKVQDMQWSGYNAEKLRCHNY
jgi:hypothetical protein